MATLSKINAFTTLKEDTALNVSYTSLKSAVTDESSDTTGFKIGELAAGSKLSYSTASGTVTLTAEQLDGKTVVLKSDGLYIDGAKVAAGFKWLPPQDLNGTGKEMFSVTALDASGNTAQGSAVWAKGNLAAVNDAPVVETGAKLEKTVDEGKTVTLSKAELLALFKDVDGDTLSITSVKVGEQTLTADADGNYSYTAPATNSTQTPTISVTVSDGVAPAVTFSAGKLTISPVNDAPTKADDADTRLDTLLDGFDTEGDVLSLTPEQLIALFNDADGDNLSIKTVIVNGTTVSVDSNGNYNIAGALAANFNGKVTIGVTVKDPSGATASLSKDVTLANDFVDSLDFSSSHSEGRVATYDVATVTLSAQKLDKGDKFTLDFVSAVVGEDGDTLNALAQALVDKITQAYAIQYPEVDLATWFTMKVVDGSITITAVSPGVDLSTLQEVVFASNAAASATTSTLTETATQNGVEGVAAQKQSASIALGENDFQPGEKITVTLDGQTIRYTVEAGDTLDAIGAKLEQAIAAANGVKATAAYDANTNTLTFVAKEAGTGFELGVNTSEIKTSANEAPALDEASPAKEAVAQVSTLKFVDGYTPKEGDTVELTVGSVKLSYLIKAGDTIAHIVDGLKGQTLTGYTLGANVAGELTITANSAGAAGPLNATIGVAGYQSNQVVVSQDQAAAAEVVAAKQVSSVAFDLRGGTTNGMDAGEVFTVSVNGVEYPYTAAKTTTTLKNVIDGLVFLIGQDDNASVTATNVNNTLVLTAKEAGTGFDASVTSSDRWGERDNGSVAATTANQAHVAAKAQMSVLALGNQNYDAGDVVTIKLNGSDYSYTVKAGDTRTDIANGLGTQLPGDYTVSLDSTPNDGHYLYVAGQPGVAFTFAGSVENATADSNIGSVSTSTEGSDAVGATRELELANDYDAGDTIKLTIGDKTVEYTVTGLPDENIADALKGLINGAGAGVTAKVEGGKLLITDSGAPVTISPVISNHGYADNTLTVDKVDAADVVVPGNVSQTQSITIVSDEIDAGDTYSVTFAGAGEGGTDLVIEYTAGPGETAAQVAENLATLVNAEAAPAIATVVGGVITLTAREAGTAFTAEAGVVGVVAGTENRLVAGATVKNEAPNAQSATLVLTGETFDKGDVLKVTVDGHDYSYTVETQGMSKADVAGKLAAQLNTEVAGGPQTVSAGIFDKAGSTYTINADRLYDALIKGHGTITIGQLGLADDPLVPGTPPLVPSFVYEVDWGVVTARAETFASFGPQAYDLALVAVFREALQKHWGAVIVTQENTNTPVDVSTFKLAANDVFISASEVVGGVSQTPLISSGAWAGDTLSLSVDWEGFGRFSLAVGLDALSLGNLDLTTLGINLDEPANNGVAELAKLATALNGLLQPFGNTLQAIVEGGELFLIRNPGLADGTGALQAGMAGPAATITTTTQPLVPDFEATVDANGNIVLTGKTPSDSFEVGSVTLDDAMGVGGSLSVNHNTNLDTPANTPKPVAATVVFDDSYDVGDVVELTVNGVKVSVTVEAGKTSGSAVAEAFKTKLGALGGGVKAVPFDDQDSATRYNSKLDLTGQLVAGKDFYFFERNFMPPQTDGGMTGLSPSGVVQIQEGETLESLINRMMVNVGEAQPISLKTLLDRYAAGTDNSNHWKIVNDVIYFFEDEPGEAGLHFRVDSRLGAGVNGAVNGNTLTLTGNQNPDGSYVSSLTVKGGITEVGGSTLDVALSTADNVAGTATKAAVATVTLADETYDAGDVIEILVNQQAYQVTLTSQCTQAQVLEKLLTVLNNQTSGLDNASAAIVDGQLVITGKDVATSLTVSTTVSDVADQGLQFEAAANGNVVGKAATYAYRNFDVTQSLDAGDSVVLQVGGKTYTVDNASLNHAQIKAKLVELVNADSSATVNASIDQYGRLQLTAKQANTSALVVGLAFNNYSAHDNDATASLTTDAKSAVSAVKEVSTVVFTDTTPLKGDSYSVTIDGKTYSYTVTSTSVTMATVVNGLVSKINADSNSGMSALRSANKLVLSGKVAGTDYSISASGTNVDNSAIVAEVKQTTNPVAGVSATAQVSTLDLAKDGVSVYDKGDTVSVKVAGQTYSVTVAANGETAADVAGKLAAAINLDGAVNATLEGNKLVLTGKQPGIGFDVVDLKVTDAVFTTGQIGHGDNEAGAAAVAEVKVYELAKVQAGDELTVRIDGTDYTVTVTHGQTLQQVGEALAAKITADGVTASFANGKLTLTGKADGTGFSASVGKTEQGLKDNGDGSANVEANVDTAVAKKTVLALSGDVKAGDKVVLTVDGKEVSVTAAADDTLDSLGVKLAQAVTDLADCEVTGGYDVTTNKLTLTGKSDGSAFSASAPSVTKGAEVNDQGAPEVTVTPGQAGVAAGEVAVETLSGSALKGDVVKIKVTLNGVEKTFTVTADNGDHETGLAQKLADQIRADADFAGKLTVADKEGRITLTAKDSGTNIDTELSVDKVQASDNNLSHDTGKDVTANANGTVASATVTIHADDVNHAIEVGDGFEVKFKLNGVDKTASYYVQDEAAGDDWQTVLGTLADRINGAGADKLAATVVAVGGSWKLVIEGVDANVAFELLSAEGTGATVNTNTDPTLTQQLQYTVGLGDKAYDVGDELVLEVASGDKTAVIRHLVTPNDALNGADLLAEVQAKLAATWGSEAPLSVSLVNNQLVFTGKQPSDVFNVTGKVNNVAEQDNALEVTTGTANVEGKPGSLFSTTLTLSDEESLEQGDVVKLHFKQGVSDTELSYTVTGKETDLASAIDTAFETALGSKAALATTFDNGSIKLAFSDDAAFTLENLVVDGRDGGANDTQHAGTVYVAGQAATADTLSFSLGNVLAGYQLELAFDADGSDLTTNDQHTLRVDVTGAMSATELASALQGVWAAGDDANGKIDGVSLSVNAGVVTLSGDNFSASMKLMEHNFGVVII